MSTAFTRTRSLRKAALGGSQSDGTTAGGSVESSSSRGHGIQSPSKLPKPSSSTTASASFSQPSNISRPGASNNNASMRPPPHKTSVSRPPLTSDNKTSSLRGGARTPTESTSTSITNRPSSSRHSRNASVSAISATSRPASISNSSAIQTRSRTGSHAQQHLPTYASTITRPPSSSSHSSIEQKPHDLHPSTNLRAGVAPISRPAFSALQQHFSPAKNLAPKTATASFLAPPSPSKLPSNIQISAETARLQAELLQLHLLHRNAASVGKQYHESARKKLKGRFEDLRVRHKELVKLERKETVRINALALTAWSGSGSAAWKGQVQAKSVGTGLNIGWDLEGKVQALDTILSGIWKLGEPGGKYARCVKRFERWVASVSQVLQERERSEARLDNDGNVIYVADLDVEWKDECVLLGRKLDGWNDLLRHLGDAGSLPCRREDETGGRGHEPVREVSAATNVLERSILSTVLRGVRELANGMLAEVQAMERIQRAVVAREEEWIREVINGVDDEEDDDGTSSVPGAVWRTFC